MYTPELAAMLIFLNRTGFNGLFRLNRSGGFNVPAGRYTNPAHLRRGASPLGRRGARARPGVTIELQPFDRTLAEAGAGDFVYCDPPYAPLSRTSSFANYTAGRLHGVRPAAAAAGGRRAPAGAARSSSCRIRARRRS